jgi:hypothetical protein
MWSWSLKKWGGLGPQGAVEPLEKKRLYMSREDNDELYVGYDLKEGGRYLLYFKIKLVSRYSPAETDKITTDIVLGYPINWKRFKRNNGTYSEGSSLLRCYAV